MQHPHKFVLYYVGLFKLGDAAVERALAQRAWNYLNDSLHLDLCVRARCEVVAAAALFLAARACGVPLPEGGNENDENDESGDGDGDGDGAEGLSTGALVGIAIAGAVVAIGGTACYCKSVAEDGASTNQRAAAVQQQAARAKAFNAQQAESGGIAMTANPMGQRHPEDGAGAPVEDDKALATV